MRVEGFLPQNTVDPDVAVQVARQLTDRDALRAHAEARHGIDPDELANPWHAAFASFVAFALGALIPLVGVLASPSLLLTAGLVALALVATGTASARLGDAPTAPAVARKVGGGMLAMAITFALGNLVGTLLYPGDPWPGVPRLPRIRAPRPARDCGTPSCRPRCRRRRRGTR